MTALGPQIMIRPSQHASFALDQPTLYTVAASSFCEMVAKKHAALPDRLRRFRKDRWLRGALPPFPTPAEPAVSRPNLCNEAVYGSRRRR